MDAITSTSHPLEVRWVPGLPTLGAIGLTFAPGVRDTSADMTPWERDLDADLERLREHHTADVLVSLLEPHEYDLLGVPDLLTRTRDVGLDVLHFPIIDAWIPRPDECAAFDDLIAAIRDSLDAGQRVVIHCRAGIGRSGLVAACVVTTYGHGAADAITLVRQAQPFAVQTRLQAYFVGQFAERAAG
jgi:protein-tyrosine phosphatase